MPGDPMAAYRALIQPQGLRVVSDNLRPLKAKPASLREGAAIPPREWLYGSYMIRRYITVLVAPGGVGKTAWTIAAGLSLVAGRALIGDWVHARTKVLFCSLEDPEDEFDRRIAAAMHHHNLDDEDVADRVFFIGGRDRRLVIAAIGDDGMSVCYPDKDAMIATIRELELGVVFVDPFVNSHELEENSNPHINAAARAWAEIANDTGCAVVLIHHTRKGAIAGDIDSGRGASALIGACRVGLTLSAMTPEDAKGYGIDEKERRMHIRMDDAKANLAPPSDKARWFKLASVPLGNGNAEYPNGDNVQAVEIWEPPAVFAKTEATDIHRVLDVIQEGPDAGQQYAPTKQGRGNKRWVGHVLTGMLGVEDEQAAKMVRAWISSGLLVVGTFHDPETRKHIAGVSVDNSKRPTL